MDKNFKENRKPWFRFIKVIIRIFKGRCKYVYLGEEYQGPCLVLSNHSGASGPLAHELYTKKRIRLWGTYEMNSGIKDVYKYLSTIYFHQKKHINKTLSKIIGFIVAPFLYIFYRGLKLIATYPDYRFKNTLKESMDAIMDNQSLIIFPENSSNGYFDKIKEFKTGWYVFASYAYAKGYDLPIFIAYYQKKTKTLVFDKKVLFSELLELGLSKEELSNKLRERCNELGKMKF